MEISINDIQSFQLFCIPNRIPALPQSLFQISTLIADSNSKISCKICGAVFADVLDLQEHLSSDLLHEKDLEEEEEVLRSDSLSTNADSIIFPLNLGIKTAPKVEPDVIKKESDFKCTICNTVFTTFKGMKQHMGKKHNTKNKPSRCNKCGKKFRHKYALKFHVKQVHEQATKTKCPHCDKSLYNKYMLAKHLEKDHSNLKV